MRKRQREEAISERKIGKNVIGIEIYESDPGKIGGGSLASEVAYPRRGGWPKPAA